MLGLINYLDEKKTSIPNEEQMGEMQVFRTRLEEASVRILFGEGVRNNSDWDLQHVGLDLVKDLFQKICETLYPNYVTFMTVSGWEQNLSNYMVALKDERLTLSIVRGKDSFEASKEEISALFHYSVLSFETFAKSLVSLLSVEDWKGRDRGKIRFLYHPLELGILEALQNSTEKKLADGSSQIFYQDIFDLGKGLGYLPNEIAKAIELLKIRRHIIYDQDSQFIAEIKVSIIEQKDLLIKRLDDLKTNVENMAIIVGFDSDLYLSKILELSRRINAIEDIEDCEKAKQDVNDVFKDINGFVRQSEGKLKADLSELINKIEGIISPGLPRELNDIVQGAVSWVSDLGSCQGLLTTKLNKNLTDLRRIAGEARGISNPSTQISLSIYDSFIDFYQKVSALREKFRILDEDRIAANSYLNGYRSLESIIN